MHRRAEGRGKDLFIQNRWPSVLWKKWQAAVVVGSLQHTGPNRLSSGIPHLTWLSFFQEAPSVGWIIKPVQQVYKAVCNFTSVLTTTNKQEDYQGANNLTWLPHKCFPCFRINLFMCTAAAVILLKTNPHPLFYSMSCSRSIYLSHSRHLL